ncbi:hypothetical protein KY389_13385 [Paracoccus bogoriensis]|uniref:hypothetical protein n=1 Tax=Paracoccus bogoriensis TaxID=242065 RepID=UPI001CA4E4DF|nr:hypothetical protein [Paracoccus bogoriensis]MBW7057664.1 hypothetical protein [Paracoccus bogoriensis]
MRYIRPRSLTWWAGLMAVATGTANLALPATGPLAELARLVTLLSGSGDASPAALIALGLGLIGLRDRLERGFHGRD